MSSFLLVAMITGALHMGFAVAQVLEIVCNCRGYRDSAIAALLAGIATFVASSVGSDVGISSTGFWLVIAAFEFTAWWTARKTCDHNDKRGKRLRAWVKSHIPKPKAITRLAPTS